MRALVAVVVSEFSIVFLPVRSRATQTIAVAVTRTTTNNITASGNFRLLVIGEGPTGGSALCDCLARYVRSPGPGVVGRGCNRRVDTLSSISWSCAVGDSENPPPDPTAAPQWRQKLTSGGRSAPHSKQKSIILRKHTPGEPFSARGVLDRVVGQFHC